MGGLYLTQTRQIRSHTFPHTDLVRVCVLAILSDRIG